MTMYSHHVGHTATVELKPSEWKRIVAYCSWLNGVPCGCYRLSAVSATNWSILSVVHERLLAIRDTHRSGYNISHVR